MLKPVIKRVVQKASPSLFYAISGFRFGRQCKALYFDFQMSFARKVFPNDDISVLSGPFKGLKYFNHAVWGSITPKWLGTYEQELHGVIDEIRERGYRSILDVGAAEGYYATGFAFQNPRTQVYSFDVDPFARRRQRQLARLNHIENLTVGEYCSFDTFNILVDDGSLVFCDIEGAEAELLDPASAPSLKKGDVLVEIHPFEGRSAEEVKTLLMKRFEDTHEHQFFPTLKRDPEALAASVPKIAHLPKDMLKSAMDEHREGSIGWLWMKVRP